MLEPVVIIGSNDKASNCWTFPYFRALLDPLSKLQFSMLHPHLSSVLGHEILLLALFLAVQESDLPSLLSPTSPF